MDNLNSLQDALWASVLRNLRTYTPRFERITMSTDASENPAELYGDGGKIYYRKEGGSGVEIGDTGSGDARYVRKDAGAGDQSMRNNLLFKDYQILKFYDADATPALCGAVYGFHGTTLYDFMIQSYNSGILTLLSDAGYIACSGDRLTDVGGITMFNATSPIAMANSKITGLANGTVATDAATVGQSVTNPMTANLAMGGFNITGVGGIIMASSGDISLDNGVIEGSQDSGGDLLLYSTSHATRGTIGLFGDLNLNFFDIFSVDEIRFKATSPTGIDMNNGPIIDVGGITMNDATSPIDMNGSDIEKLDDVKAFSTAGIGCYSNAGYIRAYLATTNHALKCVNRGIDMNTQSIIGVGGITMASSGDINLNDGVIEGSQVSGGDLLLYSTSHATRGTIGLFGDLDLNFFGIVDVDHVKFRKRTSDVASPSEGMLYYNTSSGVLKYRDGAGWKTLATV